ncbi:uncharacterized protein EI90DRAFT_2060002 [Cantharellus anzutake]|uniref:uncharacterized protein n=1 Tax=Cantharellus anzutake TaxID=1750568 RepID=UPI0019063CD1|nr:uncharacterized protein EI90DRAFT_2060002 [Cantharellus anzutake]KAF8340401.1 hypothetical protein EI90DRAFT_2060002 [Cantharellus anzutake]
MKDHTKLEACKKEIRCWLAERGSQRPKGGRLSLAQYYGDEVPEPLQIVPHTSKPKNPASSVRRQNRKEEAFAWASQSDSERDELQDEPMNETSGSPDEQRHSAAQGPGVPPLPVPHHHLSSSAHSMSRPLSGSSGHVSASRSTIKADPSPAAYQQSFLRGGGGSEDLNDELESESDADPEAKARPNRNSLDRVAPNSRQNSNGGAIVDVGGTTSTFKVSLAPANPSANEAPSLSDIRKYDDFTDRTLAAWGTNAAPNERRFTQPEYARELYQTVWGNKSVQSVTRHLLSLECFKKREPGVKIDKAERRRRENELSLAKQLLQQSLDFEKHHDGHGLAAIFGITCVLNRGGTGDWKSFLDMACAWLESEAISILQGSSSKLPHT